MLVHVLIAILAAPQFDCLTDLDCGDANPCTVDVCIAGVCQHNGLTCTGQAVECADDGNPCTLDRCNGAGQCMHLSGWKLPCADDGLAHTFDVCRCTVCTHYSADITGDGLINAADLAEVLRLWGPINNPEPSGFADLDGDRDVGPADLAFVLQNWSS